MTRRNTRARIELQSVKADPTPMPAVLQAVSDDPHGPETAFQLLDLPANGR